MKKVQEERKDERGVGGGELTDSRASSASTQVCKARVLLEALQSMIDIPCTTPNTTARVVKRNIFVRPVRDLRHRS